MFIIQLTYTKPFSEVEKYLAEHCAFLDRHYAEGTLLCSGPQNPRTGGVILCRLTDRKAVEALTVEDPFHIHAVAEYSLIEFLPTNCLPGFEAFCK